MVRLRSLNPPKLSFAFPPVSCLALAASSWNATHPMSRHWRSAYPRIFLVLLSSACWCCVLWERCYRVVLSSMPSLAQYARTGRMDHWYHGWQDNQAREVSVGYFWRQTCIHTVFEMSVVNKSCRRACFGRLSPGLWLGAIFWCSVLQTSLWCVQSAFWLAVSCGGVCFWTSKVKVSGTHTIGSNMACTAVVNGWELTHATPTCLSDIENLSRHWSGYYLGNSEKL